MPDSTTALARPEVGRLAPSPTGGLHLGHARTFLLAWLQARRLGGRVILRIEDLDASRVRPGAMAGILLDLGWLGLDWDEGPDRGGFHPPYVQSERMPAYSSTLARLIEADLVYPCTCTRKDIVRMASAPHSEDEGLVYPGTCSTRRAGDAEALERSGRQFAWRFRVEAGEVDWRDGFRGPIRLDVSRSGGDFVVGRSGGIPSYQLAVVVDDAAMGVTRVLRGDDLIPSTPRQLLLYRALGLQAPEFTHVPLACGEDGRRLAKRDDSMKLQAFRNAGVDPARLTGLIAHSCGWIDRPIATTPRELLGRVDPLQIPSEPWVVSRADLAGLMSDRPGSGDPALERP